MEVTQRRQKLRRWQQNAIHWLICCGEKYLKCAAEGKREKLIEERENEESCLAWILPSVFISRFSALPFVHQP